MILPKAVQGPSLETHFCFQSATQIHSVDAEALTVGRTTQTFSVKHHLLWVPTQSKPPSPVSSQISDDTGILEGALPADKGWTQTITEQQILDCDTPGPGCQRGLPKQAQDWKRGMSPHWNANVVSGATTMFPGIGERTTKEFTSLAPPVSAVLSATWWMRLMLSCSS